MLVFEYLLLRSYFRKDFEELQGLLTIDLELDREYYFLWIFVQRRAKPRVLSTVDFSRKIQELGASQDDLDIVMATVTCS